jgi:hypothetical protein
MTRTVAVAGLLFVFATTAAAGPADLHEVAALLAAGKPTSLQLVFDEDASTHDLCMNTLVAESELATTPLGRRELVISSAPYTREGTEHRFRVRVSARGLESVELQERRAEAWVQTLSTAFSFEPDPTGRDVEDAGDGALAFSAWGTCNRGRGSNVRGRALFVVRTYHVQDAGELGY